MKLTSRLKLVKPTAPPIVVAALATLLTMVCTTWVWHATEQSYTRTERFGASLAGSFAALAAEPLLKQDRMHLAVIGNRMTTIDEVAGVSVFSVDNQLLATGGESTTGPTYSAPVTFDESIMGYVRVTLDPAMLSEGISWTRIALSLITLLGVPWLCVAVLRLRLAPQTATDNVTAVELPAPEEDDVQHYLLAFNLYNQIGLAPEVRTAELAHATAVAKRVGGVYSATVGPLPGTGLLMHFPGTDQEDRGLQVLCAAFAVAHLLDDQAGVYRLGLHTIDLPPAAELPEAAPEISDAALLSALAKHMTLAVSDHFPLRLLQQNRVEYSPLDSPLLEEIATADGGGYLVTALSPAQTALVKQQVVRFSQDHGDSTASESTF